MTSTEIPEKVQDALDQFLEWHSPALVSRNLLLKDIVYDIEGLFDFRS